MDDVLNEDVFDHERGPIELLDVRGVNLSNLSNQEKALIQTLSTNHPAKQIRIYQTDPLHAAYIDKSEMGVDTDALKTIQEAGYAITKAGVKRPNSVKPSESDANKPSERAAVEFEPRSGVFD